MDIQAGFNKIVDWYASESDRAAGILGNQLSRQSRRDLAGTR